jgi:hypothetical protein
MNDDDLDLRRLLPPVKPLAPPDGAFERIVLTASHRRRRRVLLSVGTTVTALAIAVAGVVLVRAQLSPNHVSAASVVSSRPAAQATQPTTQTYQGETQSGTLTPDASASAKCEATQLTLMLSPVQGVTRGTLSYEGLIVVFTNKGSAPCHLSDYPGVMLIGGSGGAATLNATWGKTVMWRDPGASYVTLAPKGSASAGLEWLTGVAGCSVVYQSAEVTPPNTFTQFGVKLPIPISSCATGWLAVTHLTTGVSGPALLP